MGGGGPALSLEVKSAASLQVLIQAHGEGSSYGELASWIDQHLGDRAACRAAPSAPLCRGGLLIEIREG